MNRFYVIVVLMVFLAGIPAHVTGQTKPFETTEIKKQVDRLYNKMTFEEKVAQLYGIRPTDVMENGKLSIGKCKTKIPNGVGHICQYA